MNSQHLRSAVGHSSLSCACWWVAVSTNDGWFTIENLSGGGYLAVHPRLCSQEQTEVVTAARARVAAARKANNQTDFSIAEMCLAGALENQQRMQADAAAARTAEPEEGSEDLQLVLHCAEGGKLSKSSKVFVARCEWRPIQVISSQEAGV